MTEESVFYRIISCLVLHGSTLENHEVPKCCLLGSNKGKLSNPRLVPQIFVASYYRLQQPSNEDGTEM